MGSNGKVYWKSYAQRPFYGNQYVYTQRLTAVGSKIINITGKVNYGIGALQIASGIQQDKKDLDNLGYTSYYHTVHASASFGGAYAGMEAGLYVGAYIGGMFGGIGAIPGSIIGAAVGGFAVGYGGGLAGGQVVDWLYGQP